MKRVWILEKFIPEDEIRGDIDRCRELLRRDDLDDRVTRACVDYLTAAGLSLITSPGGIWAAHIGRMDFNEFFEDAKLAIKKDGNQHKVRVMVAFVMDTDTSWNHYFGAVEQHDVYARLIEDIEASI